MSKPADYDSFEKNFTAGKSQLVWRWAAADLETPVSAYLKLCHDEPYCFLLESVEGGAVLGRYSAIGLKPDLVWRHPDQARTASPLEDLKHHLEDSRIDIIGEDMPPMAASGLFGNLGYGMIRLIEDIPNDNPDPIGIPDASLMRPTLMVIFDNVRSMICLSVPVRQHAKNCDRPAREIYDEAAALLDQAQEKLNGALPSCLEQIETRYDSLPPVSQDSSPEEYQDAVRKGIDYIRAGDIFQFVPSLRFSMPFDLPSFELYRALRRINPSPFLFHLKFDDFALVGSSPEILVRMRDGTMTIRPIAGTRKRGQTAAEDKALSEELLADEKERSEHLMLLDLARNDIGRVAKTGSVTVTDQFTIEYYSHVMHIVSNVEGRLSNDKTALDALFAGFPAGTVSGAPKIRAMQIIDELEPLARSFYGGCIGYLAGDGDVDTCIALRTALVKDGTLYMQAGAGVVVDSDPASEYQESCNKARAIMDAAALAIEAAQMKKRQASS
ncbi:MAG: anthranilate synthase component I [Rhodospirillales bacterium]|nr:anthranilate synthase component I [Rhodospirillales bacterium]MCB9995636.1 anthranilate synthase component I [Rhodospirillales bacterium]